MMNEILIGKGEGPVNSLAKYGNRHGLIAGATGTGKTISLMVVAEGFSRMGVPVFMADVKGDVARPAMAGINSEKTQHALRTYTPRDQKAVRTAAETFVANPKLNVAEAISQLGVGEAMVSTLQEKGFPMPVEHTIICPPRCRMGAPIMPEERAAVWACSPVTGKYDTTVNRESAYEILTGRTMGKKAAVA